MKRFVNRFGELLWVIIIILTGVGIRLFDGAGTDPDIGTRNLLIGAGVLSVGALVYIFLWLRDMGFQGVWYMAFKWAIVELLWVFAIVWSGSALVSEVLDADVEKLKTSTWTDFINYGAAMKLIALLLIVTRLVIAIKHSIKPVKP